MNIWELRRVISILQMYYTWQSAGRPDMQAFVLEWANDNISEREKRCLWKCLDLYAKYGRRMVKTYVKAFEQ